MSIGLMGNGDSGNMADDNSRSPFKDLPIEEVDALADELAAEYNNRGYRKWYCGVIYQFGIEQVEEWRMKAACGKNPGGLFGFYVKQARKQFEEAINEYNEQKSQKDTIYDLKDEDVERFDEFLSENIDKTSEDLHRRETDTDKGLA